ncbi:MAG: hypothetical protein ACI4JY_12285 [Oscillospiraceae bacterium]
MGIEICILAIAIFSCLSKNTVKTAKEKLQRDGWVFFSIGAVVTILGWIYFEFFTQEINVPSNAIYYTLKFSYYFLFSLYAIISDITHIKHAYILGRLGYSNMKTC